MKNIKINIEILSNFEEPLLPQYMSDGASGVDLYAAIDKDIKLLPGKRCLIPTGIKIEIPHGYEAQIRPRSGLALNYGITVLNTPGTIDSDYRGEIKIILINLGDKPYTIKRGDRIAQMVISPVVKANFKIVKNIKKTKRNENGFGSSGI